MKPITQSLLHRMCSNRDYTIISWGGVNLDSCIEQEVGVIGLHRQFQLETPVKNADRCFWPNIHFYSEWRVFLKSGLVSFQDTSFWLYGNSSCWKYREFTLLFWRVKAHHYMNPWERIQGKGYRIICWAHRGISGRSEKGSSSPFCANLTRQEKHCVTRRTKKPRISY